MRLYAQRPALRTRQLTADVLLVAWAVLWVLVARVVHAAVLVLAEPGVQLESLGGSIRDTMGDAAGVAEDVPLVGDELSAPFGALGESGSGLAGAGQGLQDAVHTLAWVLAAALVVIPVGWALVRWGGWRLGWARQAAAAGRLDVELLAARAVATAPLPELARLPAGTGAAWRAGDAVATAALADLELRRLGLRSEARVDRAQSR
ncbi:hypothetical protein [Klenkia taihuensis]|uniref:Transmembrane protein n=1 Tax=Klenkia taihuensis TaxID=1225127 RepID=A0A1I1U9E9_9ACTN|nr:hypothetical protein [Klenkia taihuensis]GHE06815.1 hypothetical protein GCM10011381_00200 [Klenkia taihuensis]SFD67389.1 hypothetical protein SAMN05661030_3975 [Klenkia taihuensis]